MPIRSLLSVTLLAALASACSSPPREATPEAAPIAVSTARVESSDLSASFEAGGVLAARLTAVISSRVLAPITDVRVRAGDRVRRGQLLIQLDARESQARAAGSTAALEAAQQAERATQAEERAAAATLTLARAAHDRISTLVATRSATAQELDEAVASLSLADARVASAVAHREEASAALAAARSAAEATAIAASYAEIRAPFDGVIVSRAVDPGTVAAPGLALMTLEDPAGLRLEVRVDEARATQIAIGQAAQVRIDGTDPASASWLTGRVSEIARLDPAAHSFVAKIDVPANAAWRSGQFGRARFAGPSHRGLVAPAAAIIRRGQLTLVFVVSSDGNARLRPVSIGPMADNRVEILSGLSAGETLIIGAPATVVDGTRVKAAASGVVR